MSTYLCRTPAPLTSQKRNSIQLWADISNEKSNAGGQEFNVTPREDRCGNLTVLGRIRDLFTNGDGVWVSPA